MQDPSASKTWGAIKIKEKPAMMVDRTNHRTLSHKRAPLTNSPMCKRCLEREESATHILCNCEAIAYPRFRHIGHYFIQSSDYHDPHKESPTLHQKCRIDRGVNKKGNHNRS
jgi:hypothetical protein